MAESAGTIAQVGTAVVSNTKSFEAGMTRCSKALKEFTSGVPSVNSGISSAFDGAGGALTKFEFSGKAAKRTIGELAHTMGSAGGPAADLAKNMLMMGPAVGLVAGAIAVFNDVVDSSKERTKSAAENLKYYAESNKKLQESMGTREIPSVFSADIAGNIEQDVKQLEKMAEEYDKLSNSWLGGGDALRALNKEMQTQRDLTSKKLVIQRVTDEAGTNRNAFDEKAFQAHIMSNPLEGQKAELAAIRDYEQDIANILAQLPEHGKEWNAIRKEQRNIIEREYSLNKTIWDEEKQAVDKIAEKEKKAAEERAKQLQDALNNWSKLESQVEHMNNSREEAEHDAAVKMVDEMQKNQQDAANKIKESIETPTEKFKKDMQEAAELFKDHFIDAKDFEAFGKKGLEAFKKSEPVGFGGAFDTNLIDVNSYAKSGNQTQEVNDPNVKEGNRILEEIRKAVGLKQVAIVG